MGSFACQRLPFGCPGFNSQYKHAPRWTWQMSVASICLPAGLSVWLWRHRYPVYSVCIGIITSVNVGYFAGFIGSQVRNVVKHTDLWGIWNSKPFDHAQCQKCDARKMKNGEDAGENVIANMNHMIVILTFNNILLRYIFHSFTFTVFTWLYIKNQYQKYACLCM